MPSEKLDALLHAAIEAKELRQSTVTNIRALLGGADAVLYTAVVFELAEAKEWAELNDRFFRTLAFGTGGLRGRTIGKIVTESERGTAAADQPPEFPCVGTNAMNFHNVGRATRGLVTYLKEWRAEAQTAGKPLLVIAHDTRHYSKDFTELAARIATENGCDAAVFEGPRSTPELSFAVRHLGASAGVVITASHNPPHDNGFKAYFNDGAQVIEPHASAIIAKVNSIVGETSIGQTGDRGEVRILGREVDEAYMERLETLILDKELVRSATDLRIVFTPLHGTGGVIIKPMLERFGFKFSLVKAQDEFDGNFPTVESPNPENASALRLAVEQAEMEKADLVVATDPDCDRVGVAVRDQTASGSGQMKLLTGNQIGSLIAYYRAKTLFDRGVLNKDNASRGVIIKTFVTTDLQKAIAEHYGLRCVETLTGFKYIGAKLGKYERAALSNAGARRPYPEMSEEETRALRLKHSSLYVFGGEESYGYSGADFVRDKDGNGAAIMFCEVAAYAKSLGLTVTALLDQIYSQFGYFEEYTGSLTFEGADGAEIIKRLLVSYVEHPPTEMLGAKVAGIKNFETETFHDVEGDEIPKEKMLLFDLADGGRIAVRGSGTEPKIKYYLFGQERPSGARFSDGELATTKKEVGARLRELWEWLRADAVARSSG